MEDDGEAASANGVGEPAGGLDRLAGLMRVISADVVREALRDTDRANERCCVLSHEVTTWVLLVMGVLTDLPIAACIGTPGGCGRGCDPHAGGVPGPPPRGRLAPLRAVFERVVRPLMDDQVPGTPTFGGLVRVGIDAPSSTWTRRSGDGGVRAARRRPRRRRVPAGAQGQPGRTRQPRRTGLRGQGRAAATKR